MAKKSTALYSASSCEALMSDAITKNFEVEVLSEGVLGCGTFILHSPDPSVYWSYFVQEIALNCWSSAQHVQRFTREENLPAADRAIIEILRGVLKETEEV